MFMSAVKKCRNRIYLKNSLKLGLVIELSEYHFKYLIKVLRLKPNDYVCVFNQLDGEWIAQIQSVDKKTALIKVCEFMREPPKVTTSLTLIFAPIKNPHASFYVQKATELGVNRIIPVMTTRTIVRDLKIDKLEQVAIEAAEQCNRISIPSIEPMILLADLARLTFGKILFCDEREHEMNILEAILTEPTVNDAILIGPEGGFNDEERSYLLSLSNSIAVSLGTNILRAETAMITALSAYMLALKHN